MEKYSKFSTGQQILEKHFQGIEADIERFESSPDFRRTKHYFILLKCHANTKEALEVLDKYFKIKSAISNNFLKKSIV